MRQDKIASIIRKHSRKLKNLSSKVRARFDGTDIHQFRVEVKKFRAFMRLVSAYRPGRWRLPKSVREFYHAAGEIRDLQLQRQSLEALRDTGLAIPDTLPALLDRRVGAAGERAERLFPGRRSFEKVLKRFVPGASHRLSGSRQHLFVRRAAQALDPRNIPQPPADEQLHSMRKAFKDLLYAWPYLGNASRRAVTAVYGGRDKMQKATELLGDYLDAGVRLLLMEDKEFLAAIPGTDRQLLVNIETAWRGQRDMLRREIDAMLGCSLHFVPHGPVLPAKAAENPLSAGSFNILSHELHHS